MKNKPTSGLKKAAFIILFAFIVSPFYVEAQNEESSTRIFIEEAKFTQINKDWTITAEFKSGIGETVEFFPIEVINLKTNEKVKALQLEMDIKKPEVFKTAWVGYDEIEEFINFIELHVAPNLKIKYKDKSSEYIFKAKEMTLSYLIDERRKRLSIKLNSYDNDDVPNYFFWTETQVKEITDLLPILKRIMQ